MLYRILCSFNDDFGLFVFFTYLAAFCLAFVLVFVFPPGALALVLLGLFGIIGIWILVSCSRSLERSLGRKLLIGGNCPVCAGGLQEPESLDGLVHRICSDCGQGFESDGRRCEPEDDDDEGPAPVYSRDHD